MLLETYKHITYVANTAKRCNSITEGLVFQSQQVGQLFLIQFLDPLCNVVVQNERKELLLLVGVPRPMICLNSIMVLTGRIKTMVRMLRASTPVESFWGVVKMVGMVFSLSWKIRSTLRDELNSCDFHTAAAERKESRMIQCPQCKTKNPNTALKCEKCGTSLKPAQPSKGVAMNAVVNKLFDKLP